MKPLAVYIHIPFCARKCAYCDFASFAGREDLWNDYFEALGGEIDAWADALRAHEVRSVFFGGGTPSLVPEEKIASVLTRLRAHARFAADAEITLEANPGTLDARKLACYRAAGVNRLSIGVQSFDDRLLRRIGRIHSAAEAEAAVRAAHAAGFDNLSVDLMYGLPEQDMAQWADSVERALSLPIAHISAYSLIVEPDTPMEAWVRAGRAAIPDEDAVNEMQRYAIARLARAGFARYEISNFAREGYASRHNLTYWRGGEYLGLGSAAHSLMDNARFSNPPEIERYLAGERNIDRAERSLRDRREETLMLSTRTAEGLNLAAWRVEFGEDFVARHAAAIGKLERYGLIECAAGFLRLTPAGMELQDSVVLELMDD